MNFGFLGAIPILAAIAALIVWALVLAQFVAGASQPAWPANWVLFAGVGLATLLTLSAQSSKLKLSSSVLWFSTGIWTVASFLSTELIGLGYLVVALLTLGSAALRERERGKFSLGGPGVFITTTVVMIILLNLISRQQ